MRINPKWGRPYGCSDDQPSYLTESNGEVWMHRKGRRVRFFDSAGVQVGPEQNNVAPGIAYAYNQGWVNPSMIYFVAAERDRSVT